MCLLVRHRLDEQVSACVRLEADGFYINYRMNSCTIVLMGVIEVTGARTANVIRGENRKGVCIVAELYGKPPADVGNRVRWESRVRESWWVRSCVSARLHVWFWKGLRWTQRQRPRERRPADPQATDPETLRVRTWSSESRGQLFQVRAGGRPSETHTDT